MKDLIFPCFWYDGLAKEAAVFYLDAFASGKISHESPVVVMSEVFGQKLMGLNGGAIFKPNPSISMMVALNSEVETTEIWKKLSVGATTMMPLDTYPWSSKYGWLSDKYGVSWQLFTGAIGETGQKISPALMFTGDQAGRACEAIDLYTSIFSDSKIVSIMNYAPGEPDREDFVKHAQFVLNGSTFVAMDSSMPNGLPFTEGVSLVVNCDTQDEIDHFWEKLTANGGKESRCGWLKDKFGVSWQIVPSAMGELMSDPQRAARVSAAFMTMKKLDLATLINA